ERAPRRADPGRRPGPTRVRLRHCRAQGGPARRIQVMMRLLMVTQYYPEYVGGLQVVAGELARRFAGHEVEVVWAASESDQGGVADGVCRLPMRTWNFREARWEVTSPLWGPVSLARLARAVVWCDLLYLHDCLYVGNVLAYSLARCLRKPVV